MDNTKSFSLQFSPLMNVKCVKDYEEEIAQLKAENFGLKAQLTHGNLPKVLYENKQEVDALAAEKRELQRSYETLNTAYEGLLQEKRLLENKCGQEVAMCNERNGLLEDENKRLVLRLEKYNKDIQEANAVKGEVSGLRMNVQNLEKQNEQMKYDYERYFAEIREEYENFKRDAEKEIRERTFEIEGLKKKLEVSAQREKNSSFIISDLKATLATQTKDRSMLGEMRELESVLRSQIEDLQKQRQDAEAKLKSSQEIIDKIDKEHRIYLGGMEKFKTLLVQKLSAVSSSLMDLSEKVSGFKKFCFISDENLNLISKLKVKYKCMNDIIMFFKEKHAEIYKKMETLRKEGGRGVDAKTHALLQEIRSQFGEAKNELMICKKYLDKKAGETKALRIENARLVAELQKRSKAYTHDFALVNNAMKI